MKESTYRSPIVNLNYVEGHNNGQPLLMLHGNMGRWQAFSPIIPALEKNTHIYALDLRGHGKSSRVKGAYTLEDHLNDVISFIRNQIQTPVNIFGISLGGMVGLLAAARHPELIKGLILADPPLSTETLFPIVKSQLEFGNRILQYLKTNQIEKLYQEVNDDFSSEGFCACDPDIFETTFHQTDAMVKGFSIEALFPAIKCPTLLMRGEQPLGSMISDRDIEKVTKLAPHVHHIKIPEVGHSLFVKQDIVTSEVMKFLKS